MLESFNPMKRILPLNLRRSEDPPFGSLPNHSSSSVREDVIEWSVNSANLRLRGVSRNLLVMVMIFGVRLEALEREEGERRPVLSSELEVDTI